MTVIEIMFAPSGSEGDYDSRIVECDDWHWGARLDVRRDGALVAQFDAAAVLGVIDLTALAQIEDDDEHDDEDDEGSADPHTAGSTPVTTPVPGGGVG